MTGQKVGLLPFYLELYDVASPEVRPHIDEIYKKITDRLRESGIDLICVPVCRLKDEFDSAVDAFVREDVCAVITLHLAYSPSLQSIDALCRIDVPIIVLDTTEAYAFGSSTNPEEIMYNHGIHGVQDMCNLLLRRGKKFYIEAGHFEHSDVIARVGALCRAAVAAARMRHARVGIVGQPFEGMGDFSVPFDELKKAIGLTVVEFGQADRERYPGLVSQADVDAEIEEDLRSYDGTGLNREAHERTARAGLVLRRWIGEKDLTACTVNFLAIVPGSGFDCMPFWKRASSWHPAWVMRAKAMCSLPHWWVRWPQFTRR